MTTQELDIRGREAAVAALEAIHEGDNEVAHSEADDILLKYLTDLDETEVVNAYLAAKERVEFWYA